MIVRFINMCDKEIENLKRKRRQEAENLGAKFNDFLES